jgi:hypothetical protein
MQVSELQGQDDMLPKAAQPPVIGRKVIRKPLVQTQFVKEHPRLRAQKEIKPGIQRLVGVPYPENLQGVDRCAGLEPAKAGGVDTDMKGSRMGRVCHAITLRGTLLTTRRECTYLSASRAQACIRVYP